MPKPKHIPLDPSLSIKRFGFIVDMAPLMIHSFNKKGDCIIWNQQCKDILGYTKEEIDRCDNPIALFYPERTSQKIALRSLFKRDGIFREYSIKTKNGTFRSQMWADFALEDSSVISFGYDINDKKLAENSFQKAFEFSGIGMALIAPQGSWLKVNSSLCEILGYKNEELLKMTFQQITHPDDLNKDLKQIDFMLRNRIEQYQIEKRLQHKNGSYIWVLKTVSMICEADNTPLYFISQIQDIHERKLEQQALEIKTKELIRSNEELEQFSYRISHDLRSPLSTILGLSNIIDSDIHQERYDRIHDLNSRVQKSITKLDTLVKDILDLSRASFGDEKKYLINFAAIFSTTQEKYESLWRENEVIMTLDLHHQSRFESQFTRITQIVENLMSNSIKYCDHKKDERFVSLRTNEDDDKFFIEVIDNGMGIPEKFQENIFNMFFRADSEATAGSGLGLYIVQKNVEKLGGDIKLKSTPDKTSFRVSLPKEF